MLCQRFSGWVINMAKAVFPSSSSRLPLEFFREAYEKIKIEASKDVEVRMNLSFAYWFEVFPRYSEKFVLEKWKVQRLETFLRSFWFRWGSLDGRYWLGLSQRDFLMAWFRSTRRDLMERVFSRMWSRRSSPSAIVLWSRGPPVVISSYMADFLLRPNQKCCNNTWSGI